MLFLQFQIGPDRYALEASRDAAQERLGYLT